MRSSQPVNRSAERMLDVLECFSLGQSVSLAEIAQIVQLPKSTAFRLLQTLEERCYLVRDESTKLFSLGSKVGELVAGYYGGRFDLLRCAAMRSLIELNKKYNEAVRLFVRDGGFKLCIDVIESTREVRHIVTVGERHDLIRGAAGRVLLAHMPMPQRLYIAEGDELEQQLEKVQEDGYAMSVGEREESLVGIAAPIFTSSGEVIAAVSLSGPSARFLTEEMGEKIKDTVNCGLAISEKLARFDHKESKETKTTEAV